MSNAQILLAGHYCHDTLLLSNGARSETLGGSVSYVSTVLNALKLDCEVASCVGEDFAYQSRIFHTPRRSLKRSTTHFVSDFTHGERTEKGWICPLCGSSNIIGHGRQHNSDHPRRFKCGDCGKTFNEKIGTIFYHKKILRAKIITIVYPFLTGYPISNMPL